MKMQRIGVPGREAGGAGSGRVIADVNAMLSEIRELFSNLDSDVIQTLNDNASTIPVVAEAITYIHSEICALTKLLKGDDATILAAIKSKVMHCDDIMMAGAPLRLISDVAGAPSAAVVPVNWDSRTMGGWQGYPRFVGQKYYDQPSKKIYEAVTITGSVNDWVPIN